MPALVTGGSGALGGAICRALGAEGHSVAVGYFTRREAAESIVSDLRRLGATAAAVGLDVSDPGSARDAVQRAATELGGLGVVVHAAAQTADGLAADIAVEALTRILAVNVAGAANVTRAALPWLLEARGGRVVHLSSVLASRAVPGVSAYAATKGAIEAMTRALAVELGPKGVTVNAVAPGFVNAGLGLAPVAAAGERLRSVVPLRRPGTPEEVAHVVAFLASERSSYINGAVIPIDGGLLAGARMDSSPRPASETVPR